MDLHPVKYSKSLEKEQLEKNLEMVDYVFKMNVFSVQKPSKNSIHHKDKRKVNFKIPYRICVSGYSVLKNIIPHFKEGYGCCNWSFGEPLKCTCGNTLGEMYLDCYETKEVKFNPKSIERYY